MFLFFNHFSKCVFSCGSCERVTDQSAASERISVCQLVQQEGGRESYSRPGGPVELSLVTSPRWDWVEPGPAV